MSGVPRRLNRAVQGLLPLLKGNQSKRRWLHFEVRDCQGAVKFVQAETGSFVNLRLQNGLRAEGAGNSWPGCPEGKGDSSVNSEVEESQQGSLAHTLATSATGKLCCCPQLADHLWKQPRGFTAAFHWRKNSYLSAAVA